MSDTDETAERLQCRIDDGYTIPSGEVIALLAEREKLRAVVRATRDAGYSGCRCGNPERQLECECSPITRALAALDTGTQETERPPHYCTDECDPPWVHAEGSIRAR